MPARPADAVFDVTVVGSANLDLVAHAPRIPRPGETVFGDEFHEYPGGKGLNQAVAASRCGARTAFIGCLGRDAAGRQLADVLDQEEIDTSGLEFRGDVTGRAIISVDQTGENSIIVISGANQHVSDTLVLAPSQVVLTQLEVPITAIHAAFTQARAMQAITVLNPAPALDIDDSMLELTDIMVPNHLEVEALGGLDRLFGLGCRAVVVTHGGDGVRITTPDEAWHQPAFRVSPLDTTGAGDAFCGALAARLASGDDLRSAVKFAAAAGAIATTRFGAVPAQPRAAEVTELMARG